MAAHIATKLFEHTWHIGELRTASMYLLEGTREALLIDTAMGVGDLPSVIREITDLPVKVVLTHSHPDHAGGIGHFEDIYVHGADLTAAALLTTEAMHAFMPTYFPEETFELKEICGTRFHRISEGDTFDLGGRTVTVFETPGHTLGSVSLMDSQTHCLFTGDACNPNLLLALPAFLRKAMPVGCCFTSVQTCLHSLEKIKSMDYSANYTGHYDELGMNPASHSIADNLIAICEKILSGTVLPTDVADLPLPMDDQFQSLHCGGAVLSYNPSKSNEDYISS